MKTVAQPFYVCVFFAIGSDSYYKMLFQVCSFIQQILEGLGHIHSMNILHLDIKVSLYDLKRYKALQQI